MPKTTFEDVRIHACVCVWGHAVCSTYVYILMCLLVCTCTVCACVCVAMYIMYVLCVCACVRMPIITFLFPQEGVSSGPDLSSLGPTAKRQHQEVRNRVYLQTSRSTYVKPIFTYFDLQKRSSFPMVPPNLTQESPCV